MKTKKTFIPIVTLCAALFLTACTGKGAATTEKPQDSQTEASTEATGDSSTTLDDLYQQENQIFADHEDVWNKSVRHDEQKHCRSKRKLCRFSSQHR